MMLILKIPLVYLGLRRLVRDPGRAGAGCRSERFVRVASVASPDGPRPRRGGPHGTREAARRARRARVTQ